ncbi:pentatricopeptide repeat-containing protein At1g08070, chloroplastic-like [Macadamia integrifolia]|uniref:pentatricopeptide repeat-containing protein At1g08070, chloroplastic-like n=1 Tax=Macadamia integrifolia TaxID=60698 RepID=UPI001C4E6725|nr:pentatricopeptide repeat-containing protein At1g08070, chloroplastic-like [Macadamia integrifolia]
MPPCSPCMNLSGTHFMKSLSHRFKLNLAQLHLTAPTAQNSSLDPLFNLQKYKDKNQLNQILAQTISTGLLHNPFNASKLVSTFALSPLPGTTCIARLIADRIDGLDSYTWNTVIRGYLQGESPKKAILIYAHVRRKGLKVDSYTVLYVIKACCQFSGDREGGQIHAQILKMGFSSELITRTGLLQMYGLFDEIESAQQVFDESLERDLVLWNALVAAYAHSDHPYKALSVTRAMINDNMRPNGPTVVSILSVCSSLRALRKGKLVHCYVLKNLDNIDVYVSNALIDMYSKCGCLVSAHLVFQKMPMKNVISWTSIVNGYTNNNNPHEALVLFIEMESAKLPPDEVTMLGVVSMCSKLGSFEFGKWIDHYVEQHGFKGSICMTNSLMDMYARCGNLKKACQIFDEMDKKTLVSWTTIIQGLAMHGHGMQALVRFTQMQREGFRPDSVVFLSIISACSHSGLVNEGRECFRSMVEDYGIQPWMEHYGCMVDLFCRAGFVNEGFEFVEAMPVNPDAIVWRSLIGACRNQGNVLLARRILDHLLILEPNYGGNHILLSNLYAMMGEWDNVEEVRMEMGVRGVSKPYPGASVVELC